MYSHIQSKKAMGYTRDATARQLGLSWRTVTRYWEMTPEEYQALSKENNRCNLDRHESAIVWDRYSKRRPHGTLIPSVT